MEKPEKDRQGGTGEEALETLLKSIQQAEVLNVQNRTIIELNSGVKTLVKDKYPKFKKLLRQIYTDIKTIGDNLQNLDKDIGPYDDLLKEQQAFYEQMESDLMSTAECSGFSVAQETFNNSLLEEKIKSVQSETACLDEVLRMHENKMGALKKLQCEIEALQDNFRERQISYEAESSNASLTVTEKECEAIREEISVLMRNFTILEQEIATIEQEEKDLIVQKEKLATEIDAVANNTVEIVSQIQNAEQRIADKKKKQENYEQSFQESYRSKEELVEKLAATVEVNVKKASKIETDTENLTEQVNNHTNEIALLEQELLDLGGSIAEEESQIASLDNEHSILNEDIEKSLVAIKQLQEKENDLKKELEDLKLAHAERMLEPKHRISLLEAQQALALDEAQTELREIEEGNKNLENLLKVRANKLEENQRILKDNEARKKLLEAEVIRLTTEETKVRAEIESTQAQLDLLISIKPVPISNQPVVVPPPVLAPANPAPVSHKPTLLARAQSPANAALAKATAAKAGGSSASPLRRAPSPANALLAKASGTSAAPLRPPHQPGKQNYKRSAAGSSSSKSVPQKRALFMDDSDSSIDGEKLTFSQYMERKKKRDSRKSGM